MRIKQFREANGHSQSEVAKMIGTTQQTIARWEKGENQPSVAALRDLAHIFNVSIDALTASEDSRVVYDTTNYFGKKGLTSGFFGHLGLRLPNAEKTMWFPISQKGRSIVAHAINHSEMINWVCVETLNNRLLIFRPEMLDGIFLLDEAADGPDGDWETPADVNGLTPELYAAMGAVHDIEVDDDFEGQGFSETLILTAQDMIKAYGLEEYDDLQRFLRDTHIVTVNGNISHAEIEPKLLVDLMDNASLGMLEPMINLSNIYGDLDRFIATQKLALIDAPLYEVMQQTNKELADIRDEEAA